MGPGPDASWGPLGPALPRPGHWSSDLLCHFWDKAVSLGPPCWQLWGCRRMGRDGRMGHPSLWTHCTPGPSPMGVLHGVGSVILKMIWHKKCPGTAKNLVRSDRGRGSPHRSPRCIPLTHTAGRQRRPSRGGPGLEIGAPHVARATLPVRLDGRETVSQN